MRFFPKLAVLFLVGLSFLAAERPKAQGFSKEGVDLALVLAVDVSRSMDYDEQQLQRAGYVNAFRDPAIIRAIKEGALGSIAVTYIEWSGIFGQVVVAPWTKIDGDESAHAFADLLTRAPINSLNSTSISGGLAFARSAFDVLDATPIRRVIDISGDGPNNDGPPVVPTRDKIVAQGITINGLPVMVKTGGDGGFIPDLDLYYRNCVIGGPSAFLVPIKSSDEFASATRRKLILEISEAPIRPDRAQVIRVADTNYDCLIGEKRRLFQP